MSKIAIVGVDGSGKTVLMAALGEKYERPDGNGFFLSAETASTFSIVKMLTDQMRHGRWPAATERDLITSLDWKLFRREENARTFVCDFSFLDYAGEIYRLAFGDHDEEERKNFSTQIKALKKHISSADAVVVLVNLKDIISGDLSSVKTRETMWLTKDILDFVIQKAEIRNVALAFSQSTVYQRILDEEGGLQASYRKYLPHVECLYPNLKLLSVSAVDKTQVDEEGFEVPAPDFSSSGLESLMEWVVSCIPGYEKFFFELRERPILLWKDVGRARAAVEKLHVGAWKTRAERLAAATRLKDAMVAFLSLPQDSRVLAADLPSQEEARRLTHGNYQFESRFAQLIGQVTADREEAIRAAFDELMNEEDVWQKDREAYLAELDEVIKQAQERRRFWSNCLKAAMSVVLLAALSLAGVYGYVRYDAYCEEKRAAEAALMAALDEKRQIGYTIIGRESVWVKGVSVPKNPNLVTDKKEGTYRSVRPGYVWDGSFLSDKWCEGLPHHGCAGLVSCAEEGTWKAIVPGYVWRDGTNTVWQAGLANPANADLISEEEEGKWRAVRAGYVWTGAASTAWKAGLRHTHDNRLISAEKVETWVSDCAGYSWDGLSNAVWKAGLPHPENKNLTSAEREGYWQTDRPGYVWDFALKREVWSAGLPHPSEKGLKSSEKEGDWKSAVPGYVWDGRAGLVWKQGVRHPNGAPLVSGEPGQWQADKPGYRWDGQDGVVWVAGVKHPANANLLSDEKEGKWVSARVGYKWVPGTVNEVWMAGMRHARNDKLLTGDREGQWKSDCPGYVWDGKDGVTWQSGLRHPQNDMLLSAETEGQWRCEKPGYLWTKSGGCRWNPGAAHPLNSNLVADQESEKWYSVRPGYVWSGVGSTEIWKANREHPVHRNWMSTYQEGVWEPRFGYKKKSMFGGMFSELEREKRPSGRYVTESPILGTLRGLSVVALSPGNILQYFGAWYAEGFKSVKTPKGSQENLITLALRLTVGGIGGGIGIGIGSVCCAGDATLGCLDFLTFGWLGNHVFYNDDAWDMKPWFFKRKAKLK